MRASPPVLAVLVNPNARGVRRDPALRARLRALATRAVHRETTAADLPALADELCARGASLVAICGGDGTGQTTLTALARAYRGRGRPPPRIALLGGGTMNTIARNLGVTGPPDRVLARLVRRLDAGAPLPTVTQPLLAVDGRLGFLFAGALGARFLELYYEAREPGPARAALLAARVSASALVGGALTARLFSPADVEIAVEDEPPRRLAARLLVASTVVDVGVGMRVCPRAGHAPGRFHLVASALPPAVMARRLSAVRAGQPLPAEGTIDRLAARVALRFDGEEPYTLDGELFRARSLVVEIAEVLSLVRA